MNNTTSKKWVKPYPTFPLGRHPNGQLCKRIHGVLRYFGSADNWQEALRRYNREAPFWFADEAPPPETPVTPAQGSALTLDEVGNRFLARELRRHQRGQICLESYLDTRRAMVAMFEFVGRERPVLALRPDDWASLRHHLANEPHPKKPGRRRRGPDALDRSICYIRAMRSWAEENLLEQGEVIRMGDGFDRVRISEKRRERRQRRKDNGHQRMFSRRDIERILPALRPVMKAMFLLGLNGGLGASDLSAMPVAVLDLEGGVLDYDRVKTGVGRTVTLWPRTVEALRTAIPLRPKPKPGFEAHVFLTNRGKPFVRAGVADPAEPTKATRADAIASEFAKVLTGLGLKLPGLNFYAARSTFRTSAGAVPDPEAVNWIMGHALEGSGEWYVRPPLERLKLVTDHVERAIFG